MATNYGQPPHFDISRPFFSLARIEYGESAGRSRVQLAIRRYTYRYTNNSFVFLKTYKGVRQNSARITSVVDSSNVNSRSVLHAFETLEGAPSFLTQSRLRSIFAYPNEGGIFFIEGKISVRNRDDGNRYPLPNWFDIYRYGKIIDNQIVVLQESEVIITKGT